MPGLPLAGLRVLDMAGGKGELCGRLLADLGADVVLIEPPEGASSRSSVPLHSGQSLYFAVRNFNKRSALVDLYTVEGRRRLRDLLQRADVWIETTRPGRLKELGLDPAALALEFEHLVITSITDFGNTGPYRDFEATDAVVQALAGELFRSGMVGKPPLIVPGSFAYDTAGVMAAFATLVAYWQRLSTGKGQHIDLSVLEATAQCTDWSLPNFSAAHAAGTPYSELRAGSGIVYPLYPCADGWVRLVILSPRQWHAMRAWLGEPEFLQDPHWDSLLGRMSIQEDILDPMFFELFSKYGMEELSAEAQRRGIVMTPVLHPAAVVKAEHFAARQTFTETEVAPGVSGLVTSSFLEVDGSRAGFRHRAPRLGEHDAAVEESWPPHAVPVGSGASTRLPLEGLRVLDFGHGGVGVEAGRLLAEYGADVIKVESRTYPDFIRMVAGSEMSPSFASSSRSKRSFGVNVKTADGLDLIKRLIAGADVVIENNSAGTMDDLGLGYSALKEINPGIVMVSSQLMGSSGPWSSWLGYGPSTRPAGGMTWLWNFPDGDAPPGAQVIFPDHVVGRLCAIGAVTGLIARRPEGRGAHFEAAQVETVLSFMSQYFLQESIQPGSVVPVGNDGPPGSGPWGVFRCAGEERWCVITCRDDEDRARLEKAIGDEPLAEWAASRTDREVMETLQRYGVPAGMVAYASDQPDDPHLRARGYLASVDQPGVGPMILEGPAFHATGMEGPRIQPAPALGEHTREIARDLLGLDDDLISSFLAAGVLED